MHGPAHADLGTGRDGLGLNDSETIKILNNQNSKNRLFLIDYSQKSSILLKGPANIKQSFDSPAGR